MLNMLSELITSKKFTTSQLGIVAIIISAIYLPAECHTKIVAIAAIAFVTSATVIAQGLADHGSVAAEIKEINKP